MKLEQERVKTVLIDTVALLCKNGLSYERELKIQAVIGVTVDDHDVFVVHINESFSPHGASSTSASSSSAAVAAETSMALVPVLPSGQQPKREFEAARTPSSGVKRMRAESMSSSMSPLSDVARQHARQQLRFASPAKSPAAGLPGHRVPGGMSPVPRAGGVMRGPGSGRGVMRGVQRAAMGRGFPPVVHSEECGCLGVLVGQYLAVVQRVVVVHIECRRHSYQHNSQITFQLNMR